MKALWIIGVVLLMFLLAGFLRIGILATFGGSLLVRLRIGPFRLTVYPRTRKKREKEKPEAAEKESDSAKQDAAPKKAKRARLTRGELWELLQTLLGTLFATAKRCCQRLRVDPLDLTIIFGGPDPAETAYAFGAAQTAVYTLMPALEERFFIPNPMLRLRMDFDTGRTKAEGSVGVSVRICDLFAIGFTFALPLLRCLFRLLRARKAAPPASEPADTQAGESREGKEKPA